MTLLAVQATATAQVSSIQLRTINPGKSTELLVLGQGLQAPLRIASTLPSSASLVIEPADDASAKLMITLAADAPLGPAGLWISTASGISEPQVIVVDDLPSTISAADNQSLATAQQVPKLTVIEGTADAGKSDFYRFTVQAAERVAFQVLTQQINSPMDPVVVLRDASGKVLRRADDSMSGPDTAFEYVFSEAGEYVVEIFDSRYAGGHAYHLRLGDFPVAPGIHPLAYNPANTETLSSEHFQLLGAGDDVQVAAYIDGSAANNYHTVSAKRTDGQSSQWFRILQSDFPIVAVPIVDEQQQTVESAIAVPATICGLLGEAGQQDSVAIQATKGQSIRFTSVTRQVDRPTLLHMAVYNSADTKLAETAVSDSDQWSFDFAVPEDGVYRLKVRDLLNRGGAEFGYVVNVDVAPSIRVAFKPDAGTRRIFPLEVVKGEARQSGAFVLPLQVTRFRYDGPIDISFDAASNLEIINPQIPAGTNEALIYIRARDDWSPESHIQPNILAVASANPAIHAVVSGLDLHRVKSPHNPFPYLWDGGRVALSAVPTTDAWFNLEPTAPVQLAKPLSQHSVGLSVKRVREDFKAPVSLLSTRFPEGWSMQPKLEGDLFTIALTSPQASAESDGSTAQTLPGELTFLAFAEHGGRGRMIEYTLPIEWYDPIDPQLEVSETLVAGQEIGLQVKLNRKGAESQPVTLSLVDLPAGITPVTNPITVPADANEAEFRLSISSELAQAASINMKVEASVQLAGSEYKIRRETKTLKFVPFPQQIVVYPESIQLKGSRDRQRVVVIGHSENANARDWTSTASYSTVDASIAEVRGGVVYPKADGSTELLIKLGELEKRIPLQIEVAQSALPIAFENEVLVALSKQGCNSGACHGSPSGKGGFRLSLRAFDKVLDELTLIREDFGRRINVVEPTKSLLLEKPLMKVGHGGGKQIRESDEAYAVLRDWIAEGARMDPAETPRCIRLEVFPGDKTVLDLDSKSLQVAATAHFADGTSRDVTHLVAYESTNNNVAKVDAYGKVTAGARGEAVILVRYLEHIRSIPLMFVDSVDGYQWDAPEPSNYIDRFVNEKLAKLQYLPSPTCTDSEFIRRVHLDVLGILPTLEETRTFLADTSSDKRAKLIDAVLERDEYAKFWALKWGDLLKTTSKLLGNDGVYKYHRWVENAFHSNMPYDQFAKELLTASGSTLSNPPANFYRTAKDMNECVENISQVFLGARLQCAKCHNHPFEHWTQDNYYGLGAFFQRVQRRNTQRPGEMFIWYSDSGEVTQPRTGQQMKPWLPEEGSIEDASEQDRRQVFAQWLISPDNPFFAKIEANRIWSQLFARGIVDPIDDFRDSNPPTNESLLEALAQDFVASGYDRKHLLRTILNSKTYQASVQTNEMNEGENLYFSHQVPRLLSAEQLLDAINQVTGTTQAFGGLPSDTRATQLPAPDIVKNDFLRTFGQPERTTVCECEREDESNLGMAIELFNGSIIHEKLTNPNNRFRKLLAAGQPVPEIVKELYLVALCRNPSAEELTMAVNHCDKSESPEKGLEDICWALLNRDEFLFQH